MLFFTTYCSHKNPGGWNVLGSPSATLFYERQKHNLERGKLHFKSASSDVIPALGLHFLSTDKYKGRENSVLCKSEHHLLWIQPGMMFPNNPNEKTQRPKIADINIIYTAVFVSCYLWQKINADSRQLKRELGYLEADAYLILINIFSF